MRRRIIAVTALAAALLVPAMAGAFHKGEVIIDGFRLPKEHRLDTIDAQGKYQTIDVNEAARLLREGRPVFDRTSGIWIVQRPGGGPVNSKYLAQGSSSTTTATTNQGWQNIHGRVDRVDGSRLTLRADDGRRLTVDMSKAGTEIQRNLQQGDGVTVATHDVTGRNVVAEFIQKDSSAGVQPSASPTQTPVDQKNWQRIHGTVSSVSAERLMLKTDDGRDLRVDMKDVSPDVRKALTVGEGVEVAGFYRADDKHLTARYIQQDSSKK